MADRGPEGPQFKIADFAVKVLDFATPRDSEQFRRDTEGLLLSGSRLNSLYPLVFNYRYYPHHDLEAAERLTNLPLELLHSDILNNAPHMRWQLEQIILEDAKQRQQNGFPLHQVEGKGWSPFFNQQLEQIKKIVPEKKKDLFAINTEPEFSKSVHDATGSESTTDDGLESLITPENPHIDVQGETDDFLETTKNLASDEPKLELKTDRYPPPDGPGVIPNASRYFHKNKRDEYVIRG